MCRRAVLDLDPTPQAVGVARHFVAATCHRWGLDPLIDELELTVSELVTNSVLHAQTPIEVELCVASGAVEACVRDHEPAPPVVRPARVDLLADLDAVPAPPPRVEPGARHQSLHVGTSGSIAAGRGLLIVEALADEWGVTPLKDGKEVWLTMPVTWPHPESCECDARTSRSSPGEGCHHIPGPWDLADTP
jgi:hypothetical protein